jgi:acyl carrier protein
MDGLVHARRAARLPGLSINWGAWAEVGMAANVDARTKAQWQASGIEMIPPAQGVDLLFQLLEHSEAQAAVLPMNWAKLGQQADGMAFLSNLLTPQETAVPTTQNTILTELAEAPAGDRLELLQAFVQQQVMHVLGLGSAQMIDVNQGLTDIGMDSLMAVELSNRLQAGLQQSLPTTLAFEYPTVAFLTHYLAEEVLALELDEPATESVKEDAHLETVLAEIEELSDSEIEDSLLKELEDAGY